MKRAVVARSAVVVALLAGITLFAVCSTSPTTPIPTNSKATVVNLVSDTAKEFPGARADANLVNAWGVAADTTGHFWIAAGGRGAVLIYDTAGNPVSNPANPIIIPSRSGGTGGTPSGLVLNTTQGFKLADGAPARALVATEDGIIAAIDTTGTAAVHVATGDAGAVYKGIALAADGGRNLLYAANFSEERIDVFDSTFNPVSGLPFIDAGALALPADFGPFNIALIGGNLYVTYAKHNAGDRDDSAGVGNGYVSVFQPNGTFIKRLVTRGALNAPWGLTMAPSSFGAFAGFLLVGNFGDGLINVYDTAGNLGTPEGRVLSSAGDSLAINGLRGIVFPTGSGFTTAQTSWCFFTAGPNSESHGFFGYLATE